MACTTVLVGKNASYDGSTMIARNDDSCTGHFTPKRFTVVHPEEQPKVYASVLSKVTVELPDHPMRYTAVPNVIPGKGIWAAAGVNEKNVGMTATETITTNARMSEFSKRFRKQIGSRIIPTASIRAASGHGI